MNSNTKPTVFIPFEIHSKIMYWVMKGGSHECSGIGVTRVENGRIVVVDAVMVKQTNTGGSTDMDADAVARALFRFHQTNPSDEPNFWWHSHADMGVFWSSTDQTTINTIGGAGMCVASVFNKKGDIKSQVSCKINLPFSDSPFVYNIDDLPMEIGRRPVPQEWIDAWDQEYEASVVKRTYTSSYSSLYSGAEKGSERIGGFPSKLPPKALIVAEKVWDESVHKMVPIAGLSEEDRKRLNVPSEVANKLADSINKQSLLSFEEELEKQENEWSSDMRPSNADYEETPEERAELISWAKQSNRVFEWGGHPLLYIDREDKSWFARDYRKYWDEVDLRRKKIRGLAPEMDNPRPKDFDQRFLEENLPYEEMSETPLVDELLESNMEVMQ